MAITYRWDLRPIEVTYSSASMDNVVSRVHWRYYAETEATSSLGISGSFVATQFGTEDLSPVASADFTAYSSLTEDLVIGWVTASMGDVRVTEMLTNVSGSLVKQLNPPGGHKPRPW